MSRQAIQDSVDVSVDAVADLTTLINDVRVAPGTRVWCNAAGATHGLWCLDPSSAAAVDNLTIVATLSGVGRWIFFGSSGGAASGANISVNTEALLSAVGVSALKDGASAWVGNPLGGVGQSQDSYWTLVTQIGGLPTLDAHVVIASAAAGRVWQRDTLYTNWRWIHAAAWFIDSIGGNDQSDGLTNVTPIQTFAELARRAPAIAQNTTVTLLSTTIDSMVWFPMQIGNTATPSSAYIVTIVGVETLTAPIAPATGVVNAASNPVGNTPARLSDTGGAAVVRAAGDLIRVTSGAQNGAFSVVVKNEGGGVSRMSPWYNAAGSALSAPPANGDTYQIATWTNCPGFSLGGQCVFVVSKISFTSANFYLQLRAPTIAIFTNCAANFNSPCLAFTQTQWSACFMNVTTANSGSQVGNSMIDITGSGMVLAGDWNTCGSHELRVRDTIMQGGGIEVGAPTLFPGGTLFVRSGNGGLGIFDHGAANAALWVSCGGLVRIEGPLYGSGNAGGGVLVEKGARVGVASGITPTLAASAGQELSLNGLANAIPRLIQGAAVPGQQALTTWANWANAGTFNRQVVDYTDGSAIIGLA